MILEADAGQTVRVPRTAAVVQHLGDHGVEDGLARLGLRVELRTPAAAGFDGLEWIPALQRFRGAVIREDGLRPAFQRLLWSTVGTGRSQDRMRRGPDRPATGLTGPRFGSARAVPGCCRAGGAARQTGPLGAG
jgi:hypothetical protein